MAHPYRSGTCSLSCAVDGAHRAQVDTSPANSLHRYSAVSRILFWLASANKTERMPWQARPACAYGSCPRRAERGGYCAVHAPTHRKSKQQYERARAQTPGRRLHASVAWRRATAAFLVGKSCVDCGQPATVTDHNVPHRGDEALFWDESNWRPRCKTCHDRKTASHDGGFGRASARQREVAAPFPPLDDIG